MANYTNDVTVQTESQGGTLHVTVIEDIDEKELQAQAETVAAAHGGDVDMEDLKTSFVQDAITDTLKAEAPEAFDPQTPTRVDLKTDYDIQL